MKIKEIKISNILSFDYKENIHDAQSIIFDEGLNIIAGPNGSGKSNFLEIIQQLFSIGIHKQYNIDKTRIGNVDHQKNTITQQNISSKTLNSHRGFENKPKTIFIQIEFNDNDIDNIRYIIQNKDKILDIINNYNTTHISITEKDNINNIIDLNITVNTNGLFEFSGGENDIEVIYLRYFYLFQKAVDLHNILNQENELDNMKDTFALISSNRNYHSLSTSFSATQELIDFNQGITNQKRSLHIISSSDSNQPIGFEYMKFKLTSIGKKGLLESGEKNIIPTIESTPWFIDFNKDLKEFLGYTLTVKIKNLNSRTFDFFFNKDGNTRSIENFSSGEKGILYLLFSLYGYDVFNGLFIIDEPEIHLHPSLMKKYLKLIDIFSEKWSIQFIIVTHSQYFMPVNKLDTIKRFYLNGNTTKCSSLRRIELPGNIQEIKQNERQKIKAKYKRDLFQRKILFNLENREIFFAKDIVIVEGKDDRSIFRKYFSDDRDIFVLDGLNQFDLTKEILNELNIPAWAIVDIDYIPRTDNSLLPNMSKEEIDKWELKKSLETIFSKEQNPLHKKAYQKTIQHIMKDTSFIAEKMLNQMNTSQEYKIQIETKKEELLNQNIIVLNGMLEHYIGPDGSPKEDKKNELKDIIQKIKER